jgi:hypothetical protein
MSLARIVIYNGYEFKNFGRYWNLYEEYGSKRAKMKW